MFLANAGPLAHSLSIFDPASPSASSILDLAILVFAITGLILLIVYAVLYYSIWRFREPSGARSAGEPPQVYASMPIEVAWTAAPTLVVFFLVLVTTRTLWDVEPVLPASKAGDSTLFVTVIGRQWWWEYVYETYDGRKLGVITANELHIPASDEATSRPTYLTLKSADVCHSFWVPRLAGKVDLLPGRTNLLKLETTETGIYRGQCAEFCGAQHAHMLLRVVVDTPEQFERWLENEAKPAVDDPAVNAGKTAFLSESCVNCHRVRGTVAAGSYAPDLTHLMSRETLGAGVITNTPENLHRWVADPQAIKPGCLMAAFKLEDERLDLIVKYLTTLK
jgi:cytochrome c oxidase subunit II